MSKQIKFNAVKMMRDIRDKKRKLYEKNPRLREKHLLKIRKKYDLPINQEHIPA